MASSKCSGTAVLALPENFKTELQETAKRIATPGKGILAADESMATIGKRFAELGIDNTDENRRQYRQMLFNNDTLGDYVSGVILHEETLSQKDDKGDSLVDLLKGKSIIPGIKVDKGLGQLGGTRAETSTLGLDGLKERCDAFYKAGCRFAKWRAVLRIGECEPSAAAIKENAHGLARYASICQHAGLVPIVEPEVLSDGTHDIAKCQRVSQRVYTAVFKALADYHVLLEGALLKPNMVTGGHDGPKASPTEVGHLTVVTLRRTVPPAVPGIMFLSGGQSEEEATANLNAINKDPLSKPWTLSFSFGRALQTSAMHAWAGKAANVAAGQQELMNRLKANSLASLGKYTEGAVPASHMANKSNYVAKHTY